MRAIFRICGSDSQPGLLLVEKLATPVTGMISDQIALHSVQLPLIKWAMLEVRIHFFHQSS